MSDEQLEHLRANTDFIEGRRPKTTTTEKVSCGISRKRLQVPRRAGVDVLVVPSSVTAEPFYASFQLEPCAIPFMTRNALSCRAQALDIEDLSAVDRVNLHR
jgi:hypothetical protein